MSEPRFFAVLPAAGRSRRMGQAKLLLPFRRRPLVSWVIEAWRRADVPVAAVVRQDDEELARVCREAGAELARPVLDPKDMKHSIQCGLEKIHWIWQPDADDYWMLAPADALGLSSTAVQRVIDHCRTQAPLAARAVYHRGGRHPVALKWGLAEQIGQLPADAGVNHLLRNSPVDDVNCRDLEPPHDIDTPEDYERVLLADSRGRRHDTKHLGPSR